VTRSGPSRIALALIAACVLFRLLVVPWARFTGDESWFWATARNIARFEAAPVYGPSLTGSGANHPGPIFFYLMAIPQLFGSSPYLGSIFVALLHGLAALLLYLVARRAKGERAGLLSLVLLVFAPWDVLYADRVWLSCVAPVWGTAAIYAAVRAADSTRWQGALVFFLLVCPQLHMSAPIVWVLAAVILSVNRPERWSPRAIGVGLAAAIAAYAPAIYWELTHGFANTLAILREGGGTEPPELHLAPLRVFGYALLYSTSEIGYHFARGYWAPFSEVNQYATAAGWSAWFSTHGALWGAANLASIALALFGWGASLRDVASRLKRWRAEKLVLGEALGLEALLSLALLAALLCALLLLVIMRKKYFPHYTNLLMPMVLWPAVHGISIAIERSGARMRAVLLAAVAIGAIAMASSALRYYRTIDALNGLAATLGMVDTVLADNQPFALSFDGFNNQFAWQMIANVVHRRALDVRPGAPLRFRVRNAAPSSGELSPYARGFGSIVLERTPPFPAADANR
jgi:hypothetical protein